MYHCFGGNPQSIVRESGFIILMLPAKPSLDIVWLSLGSVRSFEVSFFDLQRYLLGRGCVALAEKAHIITYPKLWQNHAATATINKQTTHIYIFQHLYLYIYVYIYICDMYWYIWYAHIIYNIHMAVFEFQILKVDHQRYPAESTSDNGGDVILPDLWATKSCGYVKWTHQIRPSKRPQPNACYPTVLQVSYRYLICMFLVDGSNMF